MNIVFLKKIKNKNDFKAIENKDEKNIIKEDINY